jgi:hypothetical protein
MSDWKTTKAERKAKAFFGPEEVQPVKKKKKVDKPFSAQYRWKDWETFLGCQIRMDDYDGWHKHEFATLELAQKHLAKLKRGFWPEKKEFRIIETKDGVEHDVT